MKAYKIIALSFPLLFLTVTALFAQTYIASDTASISGVRIISGTPEENTYSIKVMMTKTKMVEYKPDQLNEYRLADGSTYVSREVTTSGIAHRVFLKRLVSGKLSVYAYYGKDLKTFYLERDSAVLIELQRKDNQYKEMLAAETKDCISAQDAIRLMRYNEAAFTKVVSQYNNNCEAKAFPFMKVGILAGYGSLALGTQLKEIPREANFEKSSGALFGVFVEMPISTTNMSIVTGAIYSTGGDYYDRYAIVGGTEIEVTASVASVDVPFLFRYTIPSVKIRPFVNAGGVISFNTKNESATYMYTPLPGGGFEQSPSLNTQSIINSQNAGYSVGGGVQYNLTYRKMISLELRYSGMSAKNTSVDKNLFAIMAGFSF